MKKVLVVLTNVDKYESGDSTGLWLSEATEFVDIIQKAGYQVDYVSPNGGAVPIEPRSLKKLYNTKENDSFMKDQDFVERALKNSLKPSDLNPNNYSAIFYTGGHAVMYDFYDNKELQDITLEIYKNNGLIASVCHGIAGILNIKNDDGNYLIKGRKVTGFTKAEECLGGTLSKVPFINNQEIKKRGAILNKARFFKPHAVKDGKIITGQNPFSTKKVAHLVVQELRENS
ncbi:type 1 glutamine amidotransferase domain-containing protein [Mycoplasma sp. Ms02]|uniref:type 1 glutamine amidotransferase domain-containing protein n=1 Tax=Mycoplasma sp. Ms02 TaxID=353851 RepID=UPI001C89341A|nr:type 1 glutamine amidotransferase domain-containing protein [Mycoplasma sp. Ms02]QZE12385.1 type 1 glutamine amidotransferase domain-containing protein [Mycoplasma sp. Ms02]